MNHASSIAGLVLMALILTAGCQTAAPQKGIVAKPVTDVPDTTLSGKPLTIVGHSSFASVELRPNKRFVLTPTDKGAPLEGEWQRRGDQVLLLADPAAGERRYCMCRVKDLNGKLCLYHETEGQFVDKRARQEMAQTAQNAEQALLRAQR